MKDGCSYCNECAACGSYHAQNIEDLIEDRDKWKAHSIKLAEALEVISNNGESRGMGWTPAQHARIALALHKEMAGE